MNNEPVTWADINRYVETDMCERAECHFLIVTPDIYGTGDSPTGYECGAHPRRPQDCPYYPEVAHNKKRGNIPTDNPLNLRGENGN